jgi:sec-independent protein translocase protein TatB
MNLGFSEMLFLSVLGLLLFGPRRLPEIGRQVGRALAEFKRASSAFQAQIEAEVRQMESVAPALPTQTSSAGSAAASIEPAPETTLEGAAGA